MAVDAVYGVTLGDYAWKTVNQCFRLKLSFCIIKYLLTAGKGEYEKIKMQLKNKKTVVKMHSYQLFMFWD